ncbi:unnamed protein product [Adineta steineri]|uniref:Uncharacterized protein n=1 Tax=Adineta steineri TaxID=433720 RepID=A0A814A6T4_9BILA|nr:unnamed protein product [Adineta steineri]CAF0934873.1 unnamed protein product [Adineta steineri]CAF4084135.1 unnamed protein product [Adineta steineri]CAF4105128.1 unnamed protein product [Adineta steineri]
MKRREWIFGQKFFGEGELQDYIVQNTVSVKRTEETRVGKKVTYRYSKYRKYPDCDFQLKVIFESDGGMTVLTCNEHNHAHHAPTYMLYLIHIN